MICSLSRALLAATLLGIAVPVMAMEGSDSLPALEQALALARAQHPGESVMLVPPLAELAQAYRRAGSNDRAEPLYEEAIHLDEVTSSNPARLGINLVDLALVYRAQDRPREAQLANERALPLLERALEPDDPEIARCLTNLAVLYWRQGEIAKARRLQEQALAMVERKLGPNHERATALRQNLALMVSPTVADGRSAPNRDRKRAGLGGGDAATNPASSPARPVRRPLPPIPAARPQSATVSQRSPESPAQAGRFAVLVSSMRDLAEVPEEWRLLQQHYPVLAGLELWPPTPEETGSAVVHRLVAGSFATAVQAEAVCHELRWQNQHCRVVPIPESDGNRGRDTRAVEQSARGDFAIQVALVRDPAEALQEWQRLVRRHPTMTVLKPRPPQPVSVAGKGIFYGVVGGSFTTRAEARAVCDRVRWEGSGCREVAL
jgi:tetratricopeptide (TPR) repeat protein